MMSYSIFQDTCLSHPCWYRGVKFENLGRKKKKKKDEKVVFLIPWEVCRTLMTAYVDGNTEHSGPEAKFLLIQMFPKRTE